MGGAPYQIISRVLAFMVSRAVPLRSCPYNVFSIWPQYHPDMNQSCKVP